MQLLEDGIIAALAAIGLVAVLFTLLSALLRPKNCDGSDAFAVVPCRGGEGARLERTVRTLERARYDCGGFCRIVILDRGMDEETRQIAALLCREGRCVSLCEEAEQERILPSRNREEPS